MSQDKDLLYLFNQLNLDYNIFNELINNQNAVNLPSTSSNLLTRQQLYHAYNRKLVNTFECDKIDIPPYIPSKRQYYLPRSGGIVAISHIKQTNLVYVRPTHPDLFLKLSTMLINEMTERKKLTEYPPLNEKLLMMHENRLHRVRYIGNHSPNFLLVDIDTGIEYEKTLKDLYKFPLCLHNIPPTCVLVKLNYVSNFAITKLLRRKIKSFLGLVRMRVFYDESHFLNGLYIVDLFDSLGNISLNETMSHYDPNTPDRDSDD